MNVKMLFLEIRSRFQNVVEFLPGKIDKNYKQMDQKVVQILADHEFRCLASPKIFQARQFAEDSSRYFLDI